MTTERQALELLEKYKLPENVVGHCKAVSKIAVEVAEKMNARGTARVDVEKVRAVGLLHDIGRIRFLKETGRMETTEERHEEESRKILEKEGLPGLAGIIVKHGIQTVLHPSELNIYEKILIYADASVIGDKRCSVDERYDYLVRKYGSNGNAEDVKLFAALKRNWPKVEMVAREIEGLV